jgi:hypothetical protein
MREADGAYGHQLQQMKDKMVRLKMEGKANAARLSADKRALAVELKAVVQESKGVMCAAKIAQNEHVRQLHLKVKVAKKLDLAPTRSPTLLSYPVPD